MSTTINGIVAYPVTPFTDDGRIDVATLHSLLDRMIDAGVHAIAPLGSAGEAAYLSDEEWSVVAAETLQHTAGRVPTVVGVSDLTTAGAVQRATLAEAFGATAVMVLPTSYWKLTEDEVRVHFTAVAQSIGIPMMVYNNPATTGIDLPPEFLVDLVSTVENITMVKESTGDISRMHQLRELSGGELPFFNGSNPLAAQAFAAGATGWCTAAPCLVPGTVVEFYRAVAANDGDEARRIFDRLQPLLEVIVSRGLPTTIKSGLSTLGIDAGAPRPPLMPLGPAETTQLRRLITACTAAA